jgi:rRNA maturation endonuclease Nob1
VPDLATLVDGLHAIISEGVEAVLAWPAHDVLTTEDQAIVEVAKALHANGYGCTPGPTQRQDIGIKKWCGQCGNEFDLDGSHVCDLKTWRQQAG